jgi:hypothetical protein
MALKNEPLVLLASLQNKVDIDSCQIRFRRGGNVNQTLQHRFAPQSAPI